MSISAQGVVERASAELSKRINGLGLNRQNSKQANQAQGGNTQVVTQVPRHTSVMERVTNVLCGGGGGGAPEKPSRSLLPPGARTPRGAQPPPPHRHNKPQLIVRTPGGYLN